MDLVIRRSINGIEETIEIKDLSESFLDNLIKKMCADPPYGVDMDPIHALRYERSIEAARVAYEEAGVSLNAIASNDRRTAPDEGTIAEDWSSVSVTSEHTTFQSAREVRMARSPEPKTTRFKRHDGTFGDPNYAVTIDCDVCGNQSYGWAMQAGGHVKCKKCKTQLEVEHRYKEPMRADEDGCVFKANKPIDYLEGAEMI